MAEKEEKKRDERLKGCKNKCKKLDRLSCFCLCKTRDKLGREKVGIK
ncbi:hypothetical protein [Clostridium vincentii]|nr:hypothetical protein [Clostridium vincentii]